jgi:protein TonB
MAYADQPTMSPRKAISIGLVLLLHAVIGYAFVTGLAYNVIKKAAQDLKVIDIQDQPPPPEQKPPPPPPEQKFEPPPIVAPPPIVQAPVVSAPTVITAPAPPVVITPAAPPAPPPPPAPVISKAAGPKGDPAAWFSTDDYPPGALRDQREGVTKIAYVINEQGRIDSCNVTGSSGSPDLDDTSCRLMLRRGRFSPALDQSGKPIKSSGTRNVRWQIPKE